MKNILFPTDFSKTSINALPFAVSIAKRTKAKLTIAHAYQVLPSSKSSGITIKNQAEELIKKSLKNLPTNLVEGVNIKSFVMRGETLSFLSHISKGCDLVIMGTKQLQTWAEQLWGQITHQFIKQTSTPVIVIPASYPFKEIKNIVLAIDENPIKDKKGLSILKEIAHQFNAELTLFHTEERATDKGIHNTALACFDNTIDFHIDFNFVQKDIPQSIEEMVVDYDVDLVGLIRRKRSFLENFFHQSITEKELITTKIPLLILQDT
ncbi:MAG: universal stress protein [Saprospiraceae bacterium]